MDLKLLITTFGMVFLAELGDKTQLATFCLSADCEASRWSVFLGSSLALVLASLLAVVFGGLLARFVPPAYIKLTAGSLFVIMGALILYSAVRTMGS